MERLQYEDADLKRILTDTKTIALIGASAKPSRASHGVMGFLLRQGYTVYPVNPGLAGGEIQGQTVYASLSDVPGPVHMVDIFRNSEAAGKIAEEAIRLKNDKEIKVVWMQLGVRNDRAAEKAEAAGLTVVMDRCPNKEYPRLMG